MADEAEGSKSLVLQLYGPKLGPKLAFAAGYGRGYNYRKVLEPTDATAQCENTGHPYKAGMLCYMCGLPIPAKADMAGASDELWPECEHILPLTEGRWLLDIYMTNRIQTDPWTVRARQLEYDQAHRVCNQAKRMDSYIVTGADGTVAVSRSRIRDILTAVTKRAATNVKKGDRRPTMASISTLNLEARIAALIARVQELVDHINAAPFRTKEGQGLVVLMQTALFVDPKSLVAPAKEVHDAWYKEASGMQETYNRNLLAFIEETKAAYPVLASATERVAYLTRLLTRNTDEGLEKGYIASVDPQVDTILKAIFDKTSSDDTQVDRSGAHFLSLVTYGMYLALYSQLAEAGQQATQRLRCELLSRITTSANLSGPLDARGRPTPSPPPSLVDVFGPPPAISAKEAAACKTFASADVRAAAAQRRSDDEERTSEDVVNEIVEKFHDEFLPEAFREINVPLSKSSLESMTRYIRQSMNVYLKQKPDDFYGAQEVAIRAATEPETLTMAFTQGGVTRERLRDILLSKRIWGRGAGRSRRRRKTYRKTSKRRKTLRKRIRARIVPK